MQYVRYYDGHIFFSLSVQQFQCYDADIVHVCSYGPFMFLFLKMTQDGQYPCTWKILQRAFNETRDYWCEQDRYKNTQIKQNSEEKHKSKAEVKSNSQEESDDNDEEEEEGRKRKTKREKTTTMKRIINTQKGKLITS